MDLHKQFRHIASLFSKEKLKRLMTFAFWWHLVKRNRKKLFWTIGVIFVILISIPIFTYIYFAGDLKDKQTFTNRSKTGLTLLDDEKKPFFTFYHPKSVNYVPLSDMPLSLQQAVIAAEDRDFYDNPGFSLTGIGRAFIRNLFAGAIVEGGSTISQELVKIALLNSDRNFFRKYQELVLATELNRRFSKKDILEMYLNSVYFGEGAFGIENAAQAYFGVHTKDLTLAQSSLLVGLLPAPSAYSPLSNDSENALARQQTVLSQMVKERYITREQQTQALNTTLAYNPIPQQETNVLAPHFALYVKDLLVKKYGEEHIIREGFVVTTTLNSKWQKYAETIVKNQIVNLQRNKATNGAVVVIDPKTGAIKVMVGSHDWEDITNGRINMATSPRQPGSSFKPLIYADALAHKLITPATILHDKPVAYGTYKPLNYDKKFRGDVTARRALANSLNIPAIEVMNMVGISSGLAMAKKLGITSLDRNPSEYGLSLVLGSGEVPLLEMTNAYAVFADQGKYHTPNVVLEIKDKYDQVVTDDPKDGILSLFNIFHVATPLHIEEKTVLSDEVAYLISSILSDNQARAEVFGNALTISRTAAVKTGTSNDYRDALTIGYTPSLVVGVWVGNNDFSPMDNIAGSLGAAPIWRTLMEHFLAGTRLEPFIQPASIVKFIPCNQTPNTTIASSSGEYFIRGTEPAACPTPTPSPTPTVTPTPAPTNTPTPSPTPSDTPTPTMTPTATPVQVLPTIVITP